MNINEGDIVMVKPNAMDDTSALVPGTVESVLSVQFTVRTHGTGSLIFVFNRDKGLTWKSGGHP